jgi:hypothetical protein
LAWVSGTSPAAKKELFDGFLAESPFQGADVVHEFYRVIVADEMFP